MNPTDTKQTWTFNVKREANEAFGSVDYIVTEELNFDTRTIKTMTWGRAEGERISQTCTDTIDTSVTPEAAANYRAKNGYKRIK